MNTVLIDKKELKKSLKEIYGIHDNIMSGFYDLDHLTEGFRRGSLYILGARPAMGKTMLAHNFIYNIAVKQKEPTLYISLEQSKNQVVPKLLQAGAGTMVADLYSSRIDKRDYKQLKSEATKYKKTKLWIEDTAGLSIEQTCKLIKKMVSKNKLSYVVIDKLQLLTAKKSCSDEKEKMMYICSKLQKIARKCEVPVLLISDIGRSCENRDDHHPYISDLRKYGRIDAYADAVFLLYRPSYYYIDCKKRNEAELCIAKNRMGKIGVVLLNYEPEIGKFDNYYKQQ